MKLSMLFPVQRDEVNITIVVHFWGNVPLRVRNNVGLGFFFRFDLVSFHVEMQLEGFSCQLLPDDFKRNGR
jgi:hypothetical protein